MANIENIIEKQSNVKSLLIEIGEIARDTKKEVYAVGGVVRDLLLDKEIKEIDLMVIGDGIEFAKILADKLGIPKIVPFPKYSTAHIPAKPIPIEVAAAREEIYSSESRKPAKVKYTDLMGDLIRRDFTINAMALSIAPENFGDLHDPYNGIKDLKEKKLITPLDPNKTFSEDPLRMMRAAYFASKLDLKIEKNCLESIQDECDRISIVSQERITNEFTKILSTDKPSIGLNILQETGLMKKIFPEIDIMYGMDQSSEWHHKDIFYHTMQVVDNAALLTKKMKLRFAALVHDIAKPNTRKIDPNKGYTFHGHDAIGERMLDKVAKRMKISNELKDYLKKLTLLHLRPIALAKKGISDSAIRRLMVAAGDDINDLLTLCRADITTKNPNKIKKYLANFEKVESKMTDVTERDKMKAFQSPVRGKEIMKICNINQGKLIGRIKSDIEEAILDGEIDNSYQAAYDYLISIKSNYIDQS
ncbi:MAG: HD domain-containing protein [Candidatus Neomarinimicrobiota bacterium]|nr:HD domain-containing protein [Candidatus Neomarinimicrobiota bacterium]|tara:strand:- start:3682 stop:5106 length:1425 start_codon:yes stop_codon:yes gene_type:complete